MARATLLVWAIFLTSCRVFSAASCGDEALGTAEKPHAYAVEFAQEYKGVSKTGGSQVRIGPNEAIENAKRYLIGKSKSGTLPDDLRFWGTVKIGGFWVVRGTHCKPG